MASKGFGISQALRSAVLALGASLLLASGVSAIAQSAEQVNCSDPLFLSSAQCRTTTTDVAIPVQRNTGLQEQAGLPENSNAQHPYVDSAGSDNLHRASQDPNRTQEFFPPDPVTDFQRLAQSSTGEFLPIFGRDLFQRAPSTFAPTDQFPATSDYVIGPGDELLVRMWGPQTFNSQLTVDTTGSIYLPKVGTIHVAGMRYSDLQKQLNTEVARVFRNFNLSVSLGHLRSIQVYVVGEARRPGAFTISSLSTLLNALFASGGPSAQGSLRDIQVRRYGQLVASFDLYDLVLHGDKSKDIRLQQGDTIFIPAVGPQVALGGSVRHPAIYEIRGETTIPSLLQYAGGYTPTATTDRLSVERIDADHTRKALTVAMHAEGHTLILRDGDVLFVNHISPGYGKSVTIRGNLANPGRFPWHPGMRLSEIIPELSALLTNDYWRERNRLGIPVPLFEPLDRSGSGNNFYRPRTGLPGADVTQSSTNEQDSLNSQALRAGAAALALETSQLPSASNSGQAYQTDPTTSPDGTPSPVSRQQSSSSLGNELRSSMVQQKIIIPTAEIDWSYAVIERLDTVTLKSILIPFNLEKLVREHDPGQNLELQPGDVITILSQADIPVPLDEQTKFIRLEGEFVSAGVYSVHPNETLYDVILRAGGLSSKAYLYGSNFQRESARVFQQQRLDEYISTLSADMERAAAVRAASSNSGIVDPNALAEQRSLVAQLRQLRASGRVVLEFQPNSINMDSIPRIPLENQDVFRVPSRPNTVSVIGAVYGQNVFLYNSTRSVEDYISLAGKPNRVADRKHEFIIRADGSIFSRERAQGVWNNTFDRTRINPGDSIVVPEKLVKPTVLRELIDYSQILSSFGLAAAAINVIR